MKLECTLITLKPSSNRLNKKDFKNTNKNHSTAVKTDLTIEKASTTNLINEKGVGIRHPIQFLTDI